MNNSVPPKMTSGAPSVAPRQSQDRAGPSSKPISTTFSNSTTDAMVIYVRRRLIEAARALREQGVVPANVDDASMYRIRPASVLLPDGDSWISATEKARQADAGVPIAWVPFAQ